MAMKQRSLTAVDLFAGCGGLSLGLKRAKYQVKLAVELDPDAAETYRLNHGDVKLLPEDLTVVDLRHELGELGIGYGELDLLAACPPCQGFSTMRTLNSSRIAEDARKDLVFIVEQLVVETMPKAVLLENVPGLRQDFRFKLFTDRLASLGYDFTSEIEDAADYGVAQHRKRLILLASRVAAVPRAKIKPKKRKTVKDAIGKLPLPADSGDPLHNLAENRSPAITKLIAAVPRDGGSRSDLPRHMTLECHKHTTGFKDVYGRLAWDAPSNTITSGCTNPSKGRFLHPEQDRALTLREALLLQGFPRSYKFPRQQTKSSIALQIGNAIPPPLAKAHALRVPRT